MKKVMPAAPTAAMTAGLRRFIYLTAGVTGAAIMVIEILGAKVLAPYLGTSHFVWTAQIAVTLLALSAGYYAGGWLVDRTARLSRLYGAILLAAVYLCGTVSLVEPVAYQFLRFKLALGSLLSSVFLFFVPLSLLAMTAPFLVRVVTVNLSNVGGNVGRLTALGTFGSFLGTILIGYVLIPFLPNSVTMYLTAVALLILVAIYFLVWGKQAAERPAVLVLILIALIIGYRAIQQERASRFSGLLERHRANSHFGMLQVIDHPGGARRYLLNDYLTQNSYDPIQKKSVSMFTYMLHGLARAYTESVREVLCIGLGVGIVPMQFAREGARVDVIEINPAVAPIARQYFDCEPEKLRLVMGDGRYFLNRSTDHYDAIVLDAFLGESSPSHLMTREAFESMQKALNPGGVLVINCFADFQKGRDFFSASLFKTLQAVFQSVKIHASGNGNVFFVAADRPNLEFMHPPQLEPVHFSCRADVEQAIAGVQETDPDQGRVLRDDYNPVEFYDAANREKLRRQLAITMKRL